MSRDTWRLLIDEPADGAANMARDEAILAAHASGATPPTLRLYRWSPACLSLGRFQRSDAIDRAACAREGVAIVRRPSGGRALLHDDELTYAIVARDDHPLFGGESVLESYLRISTALRAGLRQLGVDAELTPARRGDRIIGRRGEGATVEHPLGHSAACFDAPAAYELTITDRKLAGSAQTRRGGSLLQHGAIPLAPHATRLATLLHAPPPDLGTKMIALSEALGRAVGFAELADALIDGFRMAWGIACTCGPLTEAERREEQRLRHEKYANDVWTYGR
jgi:lipoate-protein ligase A